MPDSKIEFNLLLGFGGAGAGLVTWSVGSTAVRRTWTAKNISFVLGNLVYHGRTFARSDGNGPAMLCHVFGSAVTVASSAPLSSHGRTLLLPDCLNLLTITVHGSFCHSIFLTPLSYKYIFYVKIHLQDSNVNKKKNDKIISLYLWSSTF